MLNHYLITSNNTLLSAGLGTGCNTISIKEITTDENESPWMIMVVRRWEIKVQHMAQYISSSHLLSHCTNALHQLPVRVIVTMSLWHSVVHSDINNVSITVTGSLCVDWWLMSESRSSDERIADTSVCQSAFLVSRIPIRLTQKMDYHFWGGTSGNRMFTRNRVFSSIHPYPATSLVCGC